MDFQYFFNIKFLTPSSGAQCVTMSMCLSVRHKIVWIFILRSQFCVFLRSLHTSYSTDLGVRLDKISLVRHNAGLWECGSIISTNEYHHGNMFVLQFALSTSLHNLFLVIPSQCWVILCACDVWPVQADQAEVHDGRGGEQHIQGPVHVTPHRAKHPVTQQLKIILLILKTSHCNKKN